MYPLHLKEEQKIVVNNKRLNCFFLHILYNNKYIELLYDLFLGGRTMKCTCYIVSPHTIYYYLLGGNLMKRSIAFLIIVVLTLGVIMAGCGGGNNSNQDAAAPDPETNATPEPSTEETE